MFLYNGNISRTPFLINLYYHNTTLCKIIQQNY
nr:MAG TPA: hypothetical protein [Caudoviricetes sp.]